MPEREEKFDDVVKRSSSTTFVTFWLARSMLALTSQREMVGQQKVAED